MSEAATGRVARRGRLLLGLAALAGLALATTLVGVFGFHAVLAAAARIGWRGLAALTAWTALPLGLLGGAWFVLAPSLPLRLWPLFVWARLVRDAATELLPLSQAAGFLIGARTAILHGVKAATAFATSTADMTTELIAQLGFTALGIALLATRLGGSRAGPGLVAAAVAGLTISAVSAVVLVAGQRRGVGWLEGLARRFLPDAAAPVQAVRAALDALWAAPLRLGLAVAIHLAAWILSAVGVWAALAVAGVRIGLAEVIAIESLVATVRSAAFLAPMGLGVQEAGYAVLGPLFGLPADLALALSLVKRARDVLVGLPALAAWQVLEGRRLMAPVRLEASGEP